MTVESNGKEIPENAAIAESDRLLAEGLAATEERIAGLLGADLPFVAEVLRYAAGSGGKRFRPRLTLLSAATAGLDPKRVADVAACMECVHLATLLHDDVIDEATTRRGRPATRRRFSNNLSILAGDYIFTRVFQFLAGEAKNLPTFKIVVETTNRMVAGEFLEIWREGRLDLTEVDYIKMITLKTAKLIEASCRVGGLAGGYDGSESGALAHYGLNAGISYQIVDDYLDLSGMRESLGKEGFADVSSGKITLPVIYGLQSAYSREIAASVQAIWEGEEGGPGDLVRFLNEGGAFEKTRGTARAYAEKGKSALATLPGSKARDLLATMADWTWHRLY